MALDFQSNSRKKHVWFIRIYIKQRTRLASDDLQKQDQAKLCHSVGKPEDSWPQDGIHQIEDTNGKRRRGSFRFLVVDTQLPLAVCQRLKNIRIFLICGEFQVRFIGTKISMPRRIWGSFS